jgi:hypothetical protein
MTKHWLRESIKKHFGTIPDQRVIKRSAHKLVDIIAIAILGILCPKGFLKDTPADNRFAYGAALKD